MSTVILSAAEYEELERASKKLTALENAGVDNWVGYDDAMKSMEEAVDDPEEDPEYDDRGGAEADEDEDEDVEDETIDEEDDDGLEVELT